MEINPTRAKEMNSQVREAQQSLLDLQTRLTFFQAKCYFLEKIREGLHAGWDREKFGPILEKARVGGGALFSDLEREGILSMADPGGGAGEAMASLGSWRDENQKQLQMVHSEITAASIRLENLQAMQSALLGFDLEEETARFQDPTAIIRAATDILKKL